MLKLLETAPDDLSKQPEIRKDSFTLDRITKDAGDLKTYSSTDGKKRYLRVWVGAAATDAASSGLEHGMVYQVGKPMWFEMVATEQEPQSKR
jgi:hypothetical protein